MFRQHGQSLTTTTATLAERFTACVIQTRHELNMSEMKVKDGWDPVRCTHAEKRKGGSAKCKVIPSPPWMAGAFNELICVH